MESRERRLVPFHVKQVLPVRTARSEAEVVDGLVIVDLVVDLDGDGDVNMAVPH